MTGKNLNKKGADLIKIIALIIFIIIMTSGVAIIILSLLGKIEDPNEGGKNNGIH